MLVDKRFWGTIFEKFDRRWQYVGYDIYNARIIMKQFCLSLLFVLMTVFSASAQSENVLTRMNMTLSIDNSQDWTWAPVFLGGSSSEFSAWIANKLIKTMDRDSAYDCNLTVDFVVTVDGKVENVKVRNHPDKTLNEIEQLLVTEVDKSDYWHAPIRSGKEFSIAMSLKVFASGYVPNNGVVFLETYVKQ